MVSEIHEQWQPLDFPDLLTRDVAFVNTDSQNGILHPDGCLKHEQIWRGARDPGGCLHNTLRLAKVARRAGMPFYWWRYDRFIGEKEAASPMDQVQYHFWNRDFPDDRQLKDWQAELVDEVKAILEPGDVDQIYPGWSIFTGTPMERWLRQQGIRTLLISGYHTDWCVEMATRHARELGYMPVVVGDACGSTHPLHEQSLEQISACYAPVVTTDAAIAFMEEGLARRRPAAAE